MVSARCSCHVMLRAVLQNHDPRLASPIDRHSTVSWLAQGKVYAGPWVVQCRTCVGCRNVPGSPCFHAPCKPLYQVLHKNTNRRTTIKISDGFCVGWSAAPTRGNTRGVFFFTFRKPDRRLPFCTATPACGARKVTFFTRLIDSKESILTGLSSRHFE